MITVLICIVLSYGASLLWGWNPDGDALSGWDMAVSHVIVMMLTVVFLNYYKIKLNWTKEGLKRGIRLGLPFLALGAASALISNMGVSISFSHATDPMDLILFTVNLVLVGVGEEMLYRGLILELLTKRFQGKKKGEEIGIVIAAVIFGAAHLGNALYLPLTTVVVQSLNAASAAILFGIIYKKCRNISAVSLIHFLVDWIALIPARCFPQADSIIAMEMSGLQVILILFGGSLPPIIYGGFLLYHKSSISSLKCVSSK